MLSNISIKKYLKVLWNYKYILLLIYFILRSGTREIILVNVIFFKIVFCLLYFYLILFTTTRKDFVNCLSEIFGIFFNKKKVANFFDNMYFFVYYFVEEINEDDELKSIKGEDRIFKGFITRSFIYANNLKNYISGSKLRVDSINRSKINMLYNDTYYSKFRYRSKLNVFDYILILFFIIIYVYYIIKVR
jgi:energy-coupling factor transporter transmembrane protein EcfT